MSVITTVEAVPSRLFAIYTSLFNSENGEAKERLEAWATPPSLSSRGSEEGGSSTKLFSNSLTEARRLNLLEEVDGKLRLTAEARGSGKKGRDSEVLFRAYLTRVLFDSTRAAETQQEGFMFALAWFLSTNPLRPMHFSEDQSGSIKMMIGEQARKTECTTILNYQSFLYWARYLGFATIVGDSDARRAFPDPLRAIDSALPVIFSDEEQMPIEQFLTRLAAIFPVFERGAVRQEFDAMLLTQSADLTQRISISTSISLQRLADRQKITLDSVADAPARILNFGIREGRVSHVARRRAA